MKYNEKKGNFLQSNPKQKQLSIGNSLVQMDIHYYTVVIMKILLRAGVPGRGWPMSKNTTVVVTYIVT